MVNEIEISHLIQQITEIIKSNILLDQKSNEEIS